MKRPARAFHRRFWLVFGLLLPLGLVAALAMKQERPASAPSVLLEAPR